MKNHLSQKIADLHPENKPIIIAICGAADLGKSYLCQELLIQLKKQGINASHLTLDSYLLDRDERQRLALSGYQFSAYDEAAITSSLSQFIQHKPITFTPYDHASGKKSIELETLPDSSVLLLDGLHAMHHNFSALITLSIFIFTDDKQLKNLRLKADLKKRGLTLAQANKQSQSEFEHYKSNVEGYKNKADIQLRLDIPWLYTCVE
ncbi:MAG: hypothetical protein HRU20_12875 [Pseudomonadales bacterium]|nr:hypothetical protein [Pseudomonadales bacterium]